jgi:tetratricopeptide (TPR) repeat protein
MPLRPGETFGRYQLAELLGQGGMGEVYSAYDSVLRRKVALKVLTAPASPFGDAPPSTKGAARILREARAAAGITHPNAVSIYDVGDVDGVPFLAMELVDGRMLRSFIGDASIPLTRRVRWITDVARALGAAHQLGLVHRDIKPENVMVRTDGFVKVLDFGIARRTIEEAAGPAPRAPADLAALSKLAVTNGTLTAEGAVLGTPMYMAPEQILGGPLDGRTDQFAWGVLAHEVLTGKLPWDGEGVNMLSQILSKEVGRITERWPEIPEAVDEVIRRALRKERADRFATMDEIAEALEPFAGTTGQTKQIARSGGDAALAATEQVPLTLEEAALRTGAPARTQGQVETPRGRGSRWAAFGAIGAVVAFGVWAARALSSPRVEHQVTADAASDDAPSRMSSNPDASAAYNAGVQALRDGSLGGAVKQLRRATELDPLFGAAQLRLALTKLLQNQPLTSADLQAARTAQASLGTHDRTVLDALDLAARSPADQKESERRLEAATETYPRDADFPFQLALVRDWALEPTEAVKALDVAITRDPDFAFAFRVKGEVLLERDDVSGATEAYARCLKVSPRATTCLADLAAIQVNDGKCSELVSTAKQLMSLAPDAPAPYLYLAEGLVGSGEASDAVRAALQQFWDHSAPDGRSTLQACMNASLAILGGDFTRATKHYEECVQLTVSHTDDVNKFKIAYAQVLLDLETGRSSRALPIAEGYLRSRAGLPSSGYDFSLRMEAAVLAAGGIPRARFDDLRAQWNARNQATEPPYRWIDGYALAVETPDDAATALAALPPSRPLLSVLMLSPSRAAPIGRTYSLGHLDEGVSYLTRASASCALLDGSDAIFSTWASYDLGYALQERGDVRGACAAYQRVLDRWGGGGAGSVSRTAVKALNQKRALHCAP